MPSVDKNLYRVWRTALLISAIGAWGTLVWLLSAPSEAASAIFLGFSAQRLALGAAALLPAVFFTWFSWLGWKEGFVLKRKISEVETWLRAPNRYSLCLLIFIFLLLVSWILFFLPANRATGLLGTFSLYLGPARPLLFYGILLGLIFSLVLVFERFGFDPSGLRKETPLLKLAFVIFAVLLFVWILLLFTGLGLGFDATIWNAPGAPLLITQVFLSLFVSGVVLLLGNYLKHKNPRAFVFKRFDLALAVLVWLVAAILWLRQPAAPTYYSSPESPPNFESYPVSDAFNHDVIAQNVLVGQGFHFGGLVAIRRPLYVMFLAGLEALLGPNYDLVVTAQVIVLALFPALLCLLAARLQNRFSGLLLAGFVTLRETNSIALGHVINTSHAKLLMADLPTALGMAALAYSAVVWLRGDPRNKTAALLTGGLLGAFILLRSQTLTLIPFFVLLAILVWGMRAAWRPALLFVLGALLVVSPWIIRNRIGMGQWAIEDSIVSGFLANRYRIEPGTFGLPFLPGETEGDYYARQMASVREFALQNPTYVAGFVADNFVRNQLLNFMALPVSLELRDLEAQVRELPYWPSWDGKLNSESYLLMTVNLLLVGLGLAVAWRQMRWVGLVPLFINIGFTLNLAIARVSGWRYNLPVDWTVLLYYALGIAQLLLWFLLLLKHLSTKKIFAHPLFENVVHLPTREKNTRRSWVLALAVLLMLGNSFLIIESLSKPKYEKLTAQEVETTLAGATLKNGDEALRMQLQFLLAADSVEILNGRVLYPTFYRSGEGVEGSTFSLNLPRDFKRITFYLVGPEAASGVLRVDRAQLEFPTGQDAILFQCDTGSELAAVLLPELNQLLISSDLAAACPELLN